MDGIILVDKPQDHTSHRVVLQIRTFLKIRKVGHYGTLDPLATGLVLVAVGKATRLFPFFSKMDKTYSGKIRLGYATDTYDSTGIPSSKESESYPSERHLQEAIREFQGEFEQFPPPFSAKKFKGKPLYSLVRQRKEFELRSSRVTVHEFRLVSYEPPSLSFEVRCSSGTYIRSLAHDLGQRLGCGAHLTQLIRTAVGNFKIEDGFTLEMIREYVRQGKQDQFLIPLESLLPEFPKIVLRESGASLARYGNLIFPDDILKVLDSESDLSACSQEGKSIFRLFSVEGKLLALGRKAPAAKGIHPFLVIEP